MMHADGVDHDRDLGQRVQSGVAKIDQSIELAGAVDGVEAQGAGRTRGQRDLGQGRD